MATITILRPRKEDLILNISDKKADELIRKFGFVLTPENKMVCSIKSRSEEVEKFLGLNEDLWDSTIVVNYVPKKIIKKEIDRLEALAEELEWMSDEEALSVRSRAEELKSLL